MLVAGFVLNQELCVVAFYPIYMDHFDINGFDIIIWII